MSIRLCACGHLEAEHATPYHENAPHGCDHCGCGAFSEKKLRGEGIKKLNEVAESLRSISTIVDPIISKYKHDGTAKPKLDPEVRVGLGLMVRSYIYTNYGPIGAAKKYLESLLKEDA